MTEDRGLLRLLTAADLNRSKVVLVGDDRQLGSVGPGGALRGLVERHGEAVHVLGNNLRQRDPAERQALAELRAGDVTKAVEFYAGRERIVAAPTRDEALDAVVAGWARDRAEGHDTAMYAWRRANVEELNRRARAHLVAEGQLGGREVVAPGGRRYALGDRIVTLAPGRDGGHVTSERGRVNTTDPETGRLTVEMDDGRSCFLGREETGSDHLAHGYAVTVHRSQGATVDRAHVLADGGCRELGYVAMSRSTGPSFAYLVADDVDQAREDLVRDWSAERRQQWSIGTLSTTPAEVEADPAASAEVRSALRADRLRAERDAVAAATPADPLHRIVSLNSELSSLRQDREDLQTGRERWEGTAAGQAARELREAQQQRHRAESYSKERGVGLIGRWDFRQQAREWAGREAEAQERWEERAAPERARLDERIGELSTQLDEVVEERDERDQWRHLHPEAERRLGALNVELSRLEPDPGLARADKAVGAEAFPTMEYAQELEHDDGMDLGL